MSNIWVVLEGLFSELLKGDGTVRYWCRNGARGGFFRVLGYDERRVVLQPANGKRRSVRRSDFETGYEHWNDLKSGKTPAELHAKNYNVSYVRSILHLAELHCLPL